MTIQTSMFPVDKEEVTSAPENRSSRREVRNPVLALPAAQEILALSIEIRRPLGTLLRQLADQANEKAEGSAKKAKWMMLAYWKVVAVYAKHIAHAIDPRT
jgi:hypothetical protein